MASQVVSYELDPNTVVQFEIEPTDGYQQVGADQVLGRVQESIRPAIEAARAVMDQVARLRPAEVEVSFGIKVNGTTNWLVAKAATEANFGVKLKWRPAGEQAGDEGDTEE
ncbi:CU044_2847 family protein [Kitasatospora mediocidica]|uniref:CU044_2847 family protein n=1 Tax=Kitasatospora mediocidica TaxID=58352 RepID=UPI001E31892D|nr:CU044_2847 family protein [Kitasatospora mediocidica]